MSITEPRLKATVMDATGACAPVRFLCQVAQARNNMAAVIDKAVAATNHVAAGRPAADGKKRPLLFR